MYAIVPWLTTCKWQIKSIKTIERFIWPKVRKITRFNKSKHKTASLVIKWSRLKPGEIFTNIAQFRTMTKHIFGDLDLALGSRPSYTRVFSATIWLFKTFLSLKCGTQCLYRKYFIDKSEHRYRHFSKIQACPEF